MQIAFRILIGLGCLLVIAIAAGDFIQDVRRRQSTHCEHFGEDE